MAKVLLLQVNGIIPVLVFDGASLPMKKRIEADRKRARLESRRVAEELLIRGELFKATRKFNEAVQIDSEMIFRFI